jgi:hypothetical protein
MSKIDLYYSYNPIEIDINCISCGKSDEVIDAEPWTELDAKTKLCRACFKEYLLDDLDDCQQCHRGCSYCLT